jgi:mannose-6-phosphate isomerase-like protein (cupin superfamily)
MKDTFELGKLLDEQRQTGVDWLPFLQVPSLIAGLYVVGNDDRETHHPHEMDEVYYVIRGRGMLRVEGEDTAMQSGGIVFVAAHREHFFHSIEEELTVLVFFAKR